MSSTKPYDVVRVKDDPEAYRNFTEEYWKWVFEPNCDANSDKGYVTFMRDDSIGGPENPGDNIQEIERPVGTNLFFPVYNVHICEADPHPDGGKCGFDNNDPTRCMEAAEDDLNKVEKMWANVSINGGKAVPITTSLKDHDVTLPNFDLKVGSNDLNREPQYHLEPGTYKGLVRGTFMLLKNLKEGTYVFDFGEEASNFKTRSVYTVHVK